MKQLNITVEGMSCGGCVKKITNHFNTYEGVSSVNVDLEKKLVGIECEEDVSNMDIRSEIIELGFEVTGIAKA